MSNADSWGEVVVLFMRPRLSGSFAPQKIFHWSSLVTTPYAQPLTKIVIDGHLVCPKAVWPYPYFVSLNE